LVVLINIGNNSGELSQMKNSGIIAYDVKKSKRAVWDWLCKWK